MFLPVVALFLVFASCSTDDGLAPLPTPEAKVTSVDYYGIMNVGDVADTVRCTVVYNTVAKVADMTVKGFSFNDEMPAVDMRIAGIICSLTSTDIVFAMEEDVIPEISESAMAGGLSKPGTADENLAMSGFAGAIKDKTMEFSANMAMGEVLFQGVVVPVFAGEIGVVAEGTTNKVIVEDVQCEMELDYDGKKANLLVYGAKFAAGMPVTVDIKLEGVACSHFQGGYNIAVSDTLVPMVRMTGATGFVAMPAYTFTDLKGEVLDIGSLTFDALMTKGKFSYYGERFIKTINQ